MIKRVKMLFVEDNPVDREAFQRMVLQKHLPYEVTTVETVREARARLSEGRFDTVIADYHLPDGESTELFDQARGTPFILMTGTLKEELALRTLQRGADDYLAKDTEQRHLEAVPMTVEKTLRRRRFRDIEQRLTRALRASEEALRQQNRRLRLLTEVAAQLMAGQELDQMLAAVFKQIAEYFHVDAFAAYRLTEDGLALEMESCGGLSEQVQQQVRQVRLGEEVSYCGVAAQERRSIAVGHVQTSQEPRSRIIKALGLRAYYVTPLMVGGRVIGTLAFGSRQRDSFEPADQEFFQALASYHAMAKERLRLVDELRRHAGNLERTVSERTAKLHEAMGEMQHMSYSMVHDLRAPLRAMHSFADMLQEQAGSRLNELEREYLQRIVKASRRMDLLVTDAINYNKAVREELVLAPVDTAKLLAGMLATYPELQPPLVEVQVQGELPPVLANEAALTQCFSQFLENAVKFVSPGVKPHVRIWGEAAPAHDGPPLQRSSNPHPGFVRIWFQDNGTGVPIEGQVKIFDMFQRMHGAAYPGTGIGLALVRKLVERMGGHLGVESEVGKGSQFWIELRAAQGVA
jgi:signal transduction histidine kinase/DNA-binding response OmpR family regulator